MFCTHAVDYTGAIDNFSGVQSWTSSQWVNWENRDAMEGTAFIMTTKCKEAGKKFECFHNRRHWSTHKTPDDNALGRVAVLSDRIAERVGMQMTQPRRFRTSQGGDMDCVSYRGEEIVKPLRRQMRMLARIRHNEVYCNITRGGTLPRALL